MKLTQDEIDKILANIHKYPPHKRDQILEIVNTLASRKIAAKRRTSLLDFIMHMDPTYKIGAHHRHLAHLLEDMAFGRKSRVTVSIAPRFGKSQMTSIYFPSWFIGNFPDKKIMMVSHTSDLAIDFGRKVRNLVGSALYRNVFPDVTLSADSKSAGRWDTAQGGSYFAVGIGGAIAGRGADLLVIDDPHNEQEILSGNFEVFDKAYEWYTTGARTRLMPGGRVAVVACMTGDTRVLMADGSERELRTIKVGDEVATYENGGVSTSKVMNWKCSGSDSVYEIRTTCGTLLKANKRHPFLVDRQGELTWVRLGSLKPQDILVSLRDVRELVVQQQSQASVMLVDQKRPGTRSDQTHRTCLWGTTASGKGLHVQKMDVNHQLTQKEYANRIITNNNGLGTLKLLSPRGQDELSTDTESQWQITISCLAHKGENVQYVTSPRQPTSGLTGGENCVSTTVTTQGKSEAYYVTTVTSPLGMGRTLIPLQEPLSTYVVTRVEIEEILPCGNEDVFDVEIERTENFIANGVVSHNTRWATNDLVGRLIQDMVRNPDADQWDLVEFPAILETDNGQASLWPEQWSLEALLKTKASMPSYQWSAQYQQNPTSEESAIIKREWWQKWEKDEPPKCEYIIMALDAASEKNNRADFTSIATWGIFYKDNADGESTANIILLNAIKERMEFPELKKRAYAEYKEWAPDWFIVEKKSSGVALYQEMRAAGVPVQEFTPHRGTGDKFVRLNVVADIFASGMVWYPAGRRWAEDVVEEVCGFPSMANDDQVDTTIYALMRFRSGGFIRLPTDTYDDEEFVPKRAAYY